MRVLFLTHRLPYAPNRGDRLRAFHELHCLLDAGFAVDLVSLVHDDEEAAQVDGMARQGLTVTTVRVPRRKNLVRGALTLPGRTPLTVTLLHAPSFPQAVTTIVQQRPPDVVLAFCSSMAWYAMQPPLRQLPLVVDMVDVDSEKWQALSVTGRWPMSWIYGREVVLLREVEAAAVRAAAKTFVVNERERSALADLVPGGAIEVLPNGIDLAYFRRPDDAPPREPRVVFCGVMNYPPNVEGAVWLAKEVWPLVRAACPAAMLDIVGASPTADVRALANDALGITVTGPVPDVRPYLWRASVAAAPMKVARGVQNKVLEALAAGLPCVVTPIVNEGLPTGLQTEGFIPAEPGPFAVALVSAVSSAARWVPPDLTSLNWSAATQLLVRTLRTQHGSAPSLEASSA